MGLDVKAAITFGYDPGCPKFVIHPAAGAAWGDTAALFGFGGRDAATGKWIMPEWFSGTWDALPNPLDKIVYGLTMGFFGAFGGIVKAISGVLGCDDPNYAVIAFNSSILGFAEKWLGTSLPNVRIDYTNQLNYSCPNTLPGVSEANQAYAKNLIDYETWKCWVRSDGYHENHAWVMMYGSRPQLDAQNVVRLYQMGKITEQDMQVELTNSGWLMEQDKQMLIASMSYVTPPSDLIRMMVRDVFDTDIVTAYDLYSEFPEKYTGVAKDMAFANGITDDQMKQYWAAHWQMPSTGQLYEMYFRLRPEVLGGDNPLTFTYDDLTQAMAVNDIAPHWRDRLAAIASRVVTRVDAQRMYFAGVIQESELNSLYLQNGYTVENADQITKWQKYQKRKWYLAASGNNTLKGTMTLYKNNVINTTEAIDRLQYLGYDEETIQESMNAALLDAKDAHKGRIIKGIERWFKKAVIDEVDANAQLLEIGVEPTQAQQMISEWKYYLRYNDKQPTVAQLCNWFKEGQIDTATYQQRLERLGYRTDDAGKIVNDCAIRALPKPKTPKPPGQKALTPAQLCSMYMDGTVTKDFYYGYLGALGYRSEDADLLIEECVKSKTPKPKPPKPPKPPSSPKPPKRPTDSDLCKQYSDGVIGWETYLQELQLNGYEYSEALRIAETCAIDNGVPPG